MLFPHSEATGPHAALQSGQMVVQRERWENTNKHLPLLAHRGHDSLKSRELQTFLAYVALKDNKACNIYSLTLIL